MSELEFNDLNLEKQKIILYKLALENGVKIIDELGEEDWVNKVDCLLNLIHGLTSPTTIEEFAKLLQEN